MHAHSSLVSLSAPGAAAGAGRDGAQLSHIWPVLPFTHSPKAGRAQRGRPPCCTASPLGHSSSSSDPSGILEGGKGPEEVGEGDGGLSAPASILGQYVRHLPQPLGFGLTYPPESSRKSSGGGQAGGGREGARNLSRSPLMGSGWEALSP